MRAAPAAVLIASLLSGAPARADTPDGHAIAVKADLSNRGYKGQRAEAALTIEEVSGTKRRYDVIQLWREGGPGGSGTRTLLRFTTPPDIAGTALLTFENPDGRDDRWLYLASTQQLKRVTSAAQSSTILGSDFSYEDLNFAVLDKYAYRYLEERTAGGRPAHIVERTPRFEGSSYSKTEVAYDKEHGYPLELVFFDLAGQPLKRMIMSDHRSYDGRWRAHRIEMVNLSSGKKSVYEVQRYQLGLDLSPVLFSPSQLTKR